MLAAGSSFIGLLIFVAIAIISAMLKKRQEEPFELPPELKPRRGSPTPQEPRPRSWEEELRHLLEDRSAPPPLAREAVPTGQYHQPPPLLETAGDAGHIEVTLPDPQPNIEPRFQSLAGLTQAQGRFAEVGHIHERVAQHMTDLTHHRVGSTSVQRHDVTPEVRDVIGALRNPRSLRTAMMTAVILGPPRALEG
jgi:hypothetical protein